ncbi:MAG: hypothetical protein PW788_09485 [Micavibrio sp.]|nr:hypothetical protein [Micavibrio sp.]
MIKSPIDDTTVAEAAPVDVWLPQDVFAPLQRVARNAHKYFAEVDASILQLDDVRVEALCSLLDNAQDDKNGGVNVRLTNLDMFDFERLCFYAEEFFADLGGTETLAMTPPDITALTEKMGKYRTSAFPAGIR